MRGMWLANNNCGTYPIFREPQLRQAIPRTSGKYSIGVVAGYRQSGDDWDALVHFAPNEYETPEEAERARVSISVHTSLIKLVPLSALAEGSGDLFLTA